MDKSAKEQLLNFKSILDIELKKYMDQKVDEAASLSPLTGKLAGYISDLTLRGGKRVRAALLYHSYLAHGGKNKKEALKVAISMELAETYLLIHDDIMDDDRLRRGGETIHESYEQMSKVKYRNMVNYHHFGLSMALVAGDTACGMSNEIISESKFESDYIRKALTAFNKVYITEGYGQALDMFSQVRDDITQDDVILTHQLKTVPYTFDGPIKIGAILAGASDKDLDRLEGYTVPLGLAFQIQDDILGLFGSEEKTGKPVTSDLKEGKKTLLILDALDKANSDQREIIIQNLGNKRATIKGLSEVRKVVTETGALDKSIVLAHDLAGKAIDHMKRQKLDFTGKGFLIDLAEYVVNRDY